MITQRVAVLGSPIEHSLSPTLHNAGYKALGLETWEYSRQEAFAEDIPRILDTADSSYVGFSVTMPGKFAALEAADTRSQRAELIGSANTLVRTDSGWHADNTDGDGVLGALSVLYDGHVPELTSAVLVGSGGTARPALWALAQLGVEQVTIVNRSDRRAEFEPLAQALGVNVTYTNFDTDLTALSYETDLLISTVPSAAVNEYEKEFGHSRVLDVIYDPWPTRLVTRAASNGFPTVGGHVMLAHQAYPQFEAFTGKPAPKEAMWEALVRELKI